LCAAASQPRTRTWHQPHTPPREHTHKRNARATPCTTVCHCHTIRQVLPITRDNKAATP
jgi:hypothetical protein